MRFETDDIPGIVLYYTPEAQHVIKIPLSLLRKRYEEQQK